MDNRQTTDSKTTTIMLGIEVRAKLAVKNGNRAEYVYAFRSATTTALLTTHLTTKKAKKIITFTTRGL